MTEEIRTFFEAGASIIVMLFVAYAVVIERAIPAFSVVRTYGEDLVQLGYLKLLHFLAVWARRVSVVLSLLVLAGLVIGAGLDLSSNYVLFPLTIKALIVATMITIPLLSVSILLSHQWTRSLFEYMEFLDKDQRERAAEIDAQNRGVKGFWNRWTRDGL